jgi:phage terminase large subunit-like protein
MPARDYVAIAERYARAVVAGELPAGKLARGACARHLDDLARQAEADFPFRFDARKAALPCAFAELLPHTKGKWAAPEPGKSNLIVLEPWQVFLLVAIFGWLRKADGTRRFRRAYVEVPRKNGKSLLAAAVGLFMFAADGEFGAEVYSGATTERQAWEVFRPAKQMAERTPDFCRAFGIVVSASNLAIPAKGARFEPVIGKPGDGASPSCAIVDEFHEHDASDLYDTMETGMGARVQPLLFVITTAGDNLAGPCYDLRDHAAKVLGGVVADDALFATIYTVDEEAEWLAEEGARKANPNLGVSVSAEFLAERVADAKARGSRQGPVKTKHFNIWVQTRRAWMDMEAWKRCAAVSRPEDLADLPCVVGLDLASRVDLAARVLLFWDDAGGERHYWAFGRWYLPAARLADVAAYRGWHAEGRMVATDGDETDFAAVEAEILALRGRFRVEEVAVDKWQAIYLGQRLQAEGAAVVEVPNTVGNFSPAMKELEGAVRSGRFHHDGDPVFTWMMANVVAREDAKENVFPRKAGERKENKIDGPVALLIALCRVMVRGQAVAPTISFF